MIYWMLFLGCVAMSALVFGPITSQIAEKKRRAPIEGLYLGLILGPIGAITESLLPDGQTQPRSRPSSSFLDSWDRPGDRT